MAVRIQLRRDTSGNWVSNNPLLYPGEMGIETDTGKFKIGPAVTAPTVGTAWNSILEYASVTPGGLTNSLGDYVLAETVGVKSGLVQMDVDGNAIILGSGLIVEGATDNAYETTVVFTDPTADRTITFPDSTGTVVLADSTNTLTNKTLTNPTVSGLSLSDASIVFEGTVADSYETTLTVGEPTADRTITIPDITGTLVTTGDTGSISATMLASNSVTNAKLADDAVDTAEIKDSAVTSAKIANGTIINEDINSSAAIALSKLATDPLARANHTGTQTASTISDFNEAAQDAVGGILGTGLTYNDSSNTITVDTTNLQLRVTGVSDTEIGYLDGVTSAIQTQIDNKLASSTASTTYAPISNASFTGTFSVPTGTITSGMILDGTIVNGDISSSAAIVDTKLATISTGGKVSNSATTATDANTASAIVARDASGNFTANLITINESPTASGHAASKGYVDNIAAGMNWHTSVKAATTSNGPATYSNGTAGVGATLTASSNVTISGMDGVTLVVGNRILIKDQTDAKQNGIYTITAIGSGSAPWSLTRATDSNNSFPGQVAPGDAVYVEGGTLNGHQAFVQTGVGTGTDSAIVLGTDNVAFTQFTGAVTFTSGNGLLRTGNTIDVATADTSRIVVNTDNIDLATVSQSNSTGSATNSFASTVSVDSYGRVTGVITSPINTATSSQAGVATFNTASFTVTSGDVTIKSSGVSNAQLANSKVTVGSTDVSLGATATTLAGLTSVTSTTFVGALTGNASTVTNGVYTTDSGTVTNAMLAGSIANSKLSNSTISGVSLGSNLSALTIGTGLSGTSYNGSGAITIAIDSTVATLTGSQTLTNKTLTSPIIASISNTGTITVPTTTGTLALLSQVINNTLLTTTGDIIYASSANTPARLAAGTSGYLLTAQGAGAAPVWAAAPVSLPSQTGSSGKYLTTDGTSASWASLVVPISTTTATAISANTATTVDTTALSGFTSIEYMVSLKQGSKIRTSKVLVQTDGTSVDMTEFAITETGGTMSGVVVAAAVVSTNAVLQVTVTDASSTNVTAKFSKIAL